MNRPKYAQRIVISAYLHLVTRLTIIYSAVENQLTRSNILEFKQTLTLKWKQGN